MLLQTGVVQTGVVQTGIVQTEFVQTEFVQTEFVQTGVVAATKLREHASQPGCGADAEAPAEAETILLVEDEAFVREVTCEVLRSAGYCVLTAKNAAEAVCAYNARRSAVELLLTDVVLPGETGRALAGRLRVENPELKILLVTGYGEHMGTFEAKRQAQPHANRDADCEANHEECLAKPFSSEVLLRKVRQLLNRAPLVGKQ